MFAWPAVWYTLLIYVIGRQFIPEGGKTPTWTFDLEGTTSKAVFLLYARCFFHPMRGGVERGMLAMSSTKRKGLLPTEDVKEVRKCLHTI